MEQKINSHRLGMVVGVVAGILHLGWSVLVGAGVAQPIMDFVLGLHFLGPVHSVGEFNVGTAVVLILMASVVGYVVGWVIGAVWNRVYKA